MIFGESPLGDACYSHTTNFGTLLGDVWRKVCRGAADVWTVLSRPAGIYTNTCGQVIAADVPDIPQILTASWGGIRIPSMAVDADFHVLSATLKLTSFDDSDGFSEIHVHGDYQAQPPQYSQDETIKARPRTQAHTLWQPPATTTGVEYAVDVTDVVREITNHPERVSGDPIGFILVHVAGSRRFEGDQSPVLEIEGA